MLIIRQRPVIFINIRFQCIDNKIEIGFAFFFTKPVIIGTIIFLHAVSAAIINTYGNTWFSS